jgi:hypothetical protein
MRWNDRGAITIHVAIALIALITFTSIVVDYGVMWVSRTQAQAAADAGALAGAITLMYNASATTEATASAQHFASRNAVWGEATSNTDILVSPLPFNCPDGVPSCIRVDVMRGLPNTHDGSTHTNTLPTFFAKMAGVNSQGVRATATAQIAKGNALECIKPWVVADRWVDNSGTGINTSGWDQMDTFSPPSLGGTDTYVKSLGFSAETDMGLQLMLKGDGRDWSAGWDLEINLIGTGGSGAEYNNEIKTCPDYVPVVGLYKPGTPCTGQPDTNPVQGCLNVKTGVKQGPTTDGVSYLIGLDPSATWNTSTNSIQGGCTASRTCRSVNPLGVDLTPRVVPMALFNPLAYADGTVTYGFNGNNGMAQVTNLLGFFLEGMCDEVYATPPPWCGTGSDPSKTVVGRLIPYPGQARTASGSAGPDTFLKIVRLIR